VVKLDVKVIVRQRDQKLLITREGRASGKNASEEGVYLLPWLNMRNSVKQNGGGPATWKKCKSK
jgi:hypothetical protein